MTESSLDWLVGPYYGSWETVKIEIADETWRPVEDRSYAQATRPWDYDQVEIKSGTSAPVVVKWSDIHPAMNVANMMWRPFKALSSPVAVLPDNKPEQGEKNA